MEALLSREKAAWELANRIGQTPRPWHEHEAFIRSKYAEILALPEEYRDVAFVEGHLGNAAMLEATLKHIDSVLLPLARAREASKRSKRRSKKKKKRGRP